MRMRFPLAFCTFFLSVIISAPALSQDSSQAAESAEFRAKLGVMAERIEKSVKILREQIIQNQSAPFLADLYLQLGDLLSEKSNVLYYQQKERGLGDDLKIDEKNSSHPIVTTQKEAISIYQQILKEFPSFNKQGKVLYRLALAQKSIGEDAAFVLSSETLIRREPKTKEAMQVRLLLGNFYYDQGDYKSAVAALTPAEKSEFPYERNAARYRLGLISQNEERFAQALQYFEKVATDEELKEEDNPLEVSIQTRTVNSNIKREALIDSIKAFTEVYKKNADPIGFYNRVSPTEVLFQEVIEKLAFRYVFLKKEDQAIALLRVLSERIADPQKVINIYRDVLMMIPPNERIEVPVSEMQYVLGKYQDWINYFDIKTQTRREAYFFFEKQIREMGTKSHDLAKSEFSSVRKESLYGRAGDFYVLYLAHFGKGEHAVKIATNLADVYYYQKKFLDAGNYYLKVFLGEYGSPKSLAAPQAREELIKNAILCLQKPAPGDYYEIVRTRGLLVKAVRLYMNLDPKRKSDPKLNFILVKSAYDQGLYDTALPALVRYVKRFPKAHVEAEAAVDIGLDYYNLRSDFDGLVSWSDQFLSMKEVSPQIKQKLSSVRSKALLKQIDEDVQKKSNFDAFSQGALYFETALSVQDAALKSVVLEQALAKSKAENDINTFLKAAQALAGAEKNPEKRAGILLGMAEQTLAIGRFYQTFDIWNQVLSAGGISGGMKSRVKEQALRLAIMLKDWEKIHRFSRDPGVSDTLRQSAVTQLVRQMTSSAKVPVSQFKNPEMSKFSPDELLPYFLGQFKAPEGTRSAIVAQARQRCAKNSSTLLCQWAKAQAFSHLGQTFESRLKSAKPALESVEVQAKGFSSLLDRVSGMGASGEPTLDMFVATIKAKLYQDFSQFLLRVGNANKSVAEVLSSKSSESLQSARVEYQTCQEIVSRSGAFSPVNSFCKARRSPSFRQALTWRVEVRDPLPTKDPTSKSIEELRKSIFVQPNKPEPYLDLALLFFQGRSYHHALAMSSYGMSTFSGFKDSFSLIMGCALTEMGVLDEAQFHLKSSSDYKSAKAGCLRSLAARSK